MLIKRVSTEQHLIDAAKPQAQVGRDVGKAAACVSWLHLFTTASLWANDLAFSSLIASPVKLRKRVEPNRDIVTMK